MRTEVYELMGLDGAALYARMWLPDNEPKAILQITHGMTEHIGRYESFCTGDDCARYCCGWI